MPPLDRARELLAPPLSRDYGLVGTAFDYLLRFYIQRLNPVPSPGSLALGDVDGDGQVDVVQYNLVSSTGVPAGQCPCTLQRGAGTKIVGLPLAQPAPQFNQQVNGVINSAGGLANSWVIAGTTGPVTHNVRYASYKTDPIFRYYDQFGCELTPAAAAATNAAFNIVVTATCTAAPKTVADVRAIRITVNALSTVIDAVTQTFPASSMTASARIANK